MRGVGRAPSEMDSFITIIHPKAIIPTWLSKEIISYSIPFIHLPDKRVSHSHKIIHTYISIYSLIRPHQNHNKSHDSITPMNDLSYSYELNDTLRISDSYEWNRSCRNSSPVTIAG